MALPAATGSAGAHSKCLMLYCSCCDALPTPSPHLLPYKHIPPRLPPLQQQEVQLQEVQVPQALLRLLCRRRLLRAPVQLRRLLQPPRQHVSACHWCKQHCIRTVDLRVHCGFSGPLVQLRLLACLPCIFNC